MKITSHTDPFPFLYIENIYTEEELRLIFAELDYYQSNQTVLKSNTLPATDRDGNIKAKKNGNFLDCIFQNRQYSNILNINRKLFEKGLICGRLDNYFFRHFAPTQDFSLFSYYENEDKYEPHVDNCVVSICIWLWKEPKRFEGGDFCFPDFNKRIKVKSNHAVVFPSGILHSVDKIQMLPEHMGKGLGRYSICNFLNFKE
tara:strand:+ start:126 stop:728 length:603 start_codon:yes stop_codon:yes gene_type:complete